MKAQLVALADAANVSVEGKLNIHGEFDVLWSDTEPITFMLFHFVAKLKSGEEDIGVYPFELLVLDEDMQLVAKLASGQLSLNGNPNPGIETGLPIIIQIVNASFPRYGTYSFCLQIAGQEVCSCYLHCRPRPQAPG